MFGRRKDDVNAFVSKPVPPLVEPGTITIVPGFTNRATPDAMDRLTSLASTVYVAKDAKVLYVQVPKSACTTMLWTMVDLAGLDHDSLAFSTWESVSASQSIHDPAIHPVPTIDQVSGKVRAKALTSPKWMRLAVIRDPYARLYSAWESRVLLANPGPWLDFPQAELVRQGDSIDVVASFRAFLDVMVEHQGIWQSNPHFAQQVYVMALDEIDYTDIVPTSGLTDLFDRLGDRIGRPLTPERHNEGLGIKPEQVYDARTAALCEQMFDADFDRLGFARRTFTAPERVVLEGSSARLLTMVRERNERISALSRHRCSKAKHSS